MKRRITIIFASGLLLAAAAGSALAHDGANGVEAQEQCDVESENEQVDAQCEQNDDYDVNDVDDKDKNNVDDVARNEGPHGNDDEQSDNDDDGED